MKYIYFYGGPLDGEHREVPMGTARYVGFWLGEGHVYEKYEAWKPNEAGESEWFHYVGRLDA